VVGRASRDYPLFYASEMLVFVSERPVTRRSLLGDHASQLVVNGQTRAQGVVRLDLIEQIRPLVLGGRAVRSIKSRGSIPGKGL
jgi:hypothetical protein